MGFEQFYLYDNNKSSGGDGTLHANKYGFSIMATKRRIRVIIYGQEASIDHFIKNYQHESKWVAFFDLDEFIFSKNNINLIHYLKSQPNDVSSICMHQKKFLDRFLSKKKLITQEYSCISEKQISKRWANI